MLQGRKDNIVQMGAFDIHTILILLTGSLQSRSNYFSSVKIYGRLRLSPLAYSYTQTTTNCINYQYIQYTAQIAILSRKLMNKDITGGKQERSRWCYISLHSWDC